MLRMKVNLRPEVYQALLAESRVRQQDPEAVLEDMIMTSISPTTEEVLEELKRNMEMKPALEGNQEAIEAIKDLWVDYPRLSTFDIADKIGYPYDAVGDAIKVMLRKGELEPRGHLPPISKTKR